MFGRKKQAGEPSLVGLVERVEERFGSRVRRVRREVPGVVYWRLEERFGLGLTVDAGHRSMHMAFYAAPNVELTAIFGRPFSIAWSRAALDANLDMVEEYLQLRRQDGGAS